MTRQSRRSGTNRGASISKFKKGIVPVSEAAPFAKVLVYGRNGKGKTRFAASGPKTVIFDVNEEGTQSVKSYPNTFVRPIKKWEELIWGYWYLREGDHKFETVVIDTLTQAQKLCMSQVLREAEDRDPNRPPKTPDRRAWGQMGELLRPVIFDFRNLSMNVVFVCQERVDKPDEEEEGDVRTRYVPDLSPGVRGDAMAAVGVMGRVYRRPVRRGKGKKEKVVWETRMLVGDHEDYETKDRTFQLGHIVRNPTMTKVIQAWAASPPDEEDE